MAQETSAKSYGILIANIRPYDIGRTMLRSAGPYLKVIDAEPEAAARAVGMVA
jgi:hypothetical protein